MTGDLTTGVAAARSPSPRAALADRYRTRGVEHDVFVARLSSMRWLVLDVTVSDVVIVETLEGSDDRFEQACALARDYVTEKRAYHEHRRDDDPLPAPSTARRRDDRAARS